MEHREKLKFIPGYSTWVEILPITKGWSLETKFRVKTSGGHFLLIRLTESGLYQRKKKEFEAMKKFSLQNLNISHPVAFGHIPQENLVYIIYTWVDGIDAELKITTLSPQIQYEYGRKAGKILQEIHRHPAPPNISPWEVKMRQKIEKMVSAYELMDVKLDYDRNVIDFLDENLHLLHNRPQTLQHGDFHLGNMVIGKENLETKIGELGVIDFNRLSFGDPWEEFERCYFTVQKSIPFMNGQIHSYFDDEVPEPFFRLLALYTGYSCIASIPWSEPFGIPETKKMAVMSNLIIDGFQNFRDYMPKWYTEPN